ncbi:MAG: 50S ribosomal protein L13 [Thermoproteales archaeon]|nr:50S ribosomal protein L13 [Thermoproteales archaeon]
MSEEKLIVVNAEGLVAGRLASIVAKKLLNGENVVIINAEKAIITGKPQRIVNMYMKKINEWRTHFNPEKRGPKIPRRPDRVLKRMVRGMLPHKKPKGRMAYKRLKVYIGVPDNVNVKEAISIKEAMRKNENVPFITLGELYVRLGGKL